MWHQRPKHGDIKQRTHMETKRGQTAKQTTTKRIAQKTKKISKPMHIAKHWGQTAKTIKRIVYIILNSNRENEHAYSIYAQTADIQNKQRINML